LSGGARLLCNLLWSRGGVKDAMAQGTGHLAYKIAANLRQAQVGESRSHRIVDHLLFTVYC
ncbi:MAG: hypothetical protein OES18_25095, partial [Deltaproteobacteria bacterium]|nr:hypothetical protein [Deltaproteobacteria bacterium]